MLIFFLVLFFFSAHAQSCQFDFQCNPWLMCVNHVCVPNPDFPQPSTAAVNEASTVISTTSVASAGCAADKDCPPKETCVSGKCESIPEWTTTTVAGCTSDAQCPPLQVCTNGTCTANSSTSTTQSTKSCTLNIDCSSTQVCALGVCMDIASLTTTPPTTTTTFSTAACETTYECYPNHYCYLGTCTIVPGAGETGCPCSSNDYCAPGYQCSSGTCDLIATTATTRRVKSGCGSGWRRHENYCFYLVHGPFTYHHSAGWCRDAGAQLLTIPNASISNYINHVYSAGGAAPYWIGLRKVGGAWRWPNGTVATYTNWKPGQPDGCCGNDVTCALANYDNVLGQWDDTDCNISSSESYGFGFVCQKMLPEGA